MVMKDPIPRAQREGATPRLPAKRVENPSAGRGSVVEVSISLQVVLAVPPGEQFDGVWEKVGVTMSSPARSVVSRSCARPAGLNHTADGSSATAVNAPPEPTARASMRLGR